MALMRLSRGKQNLELKNIERKKNNFVAFTTTNIAFTTSPQN